MTLPVVRVLRTATAGANALAGGAGLIAMLLAAPSTMATNITSGTYIAASYYDGGIAYASYATPAGTGCPGICYTNGLPSQNVILNDPGAPYAGAAATANLSSDALDIGTTGSNGVTEATAEMWDTLNLYNLPTGPTVTPTTTLGDLVMTVTTSAGTAKYGINANGAFGLQVFNTATFVQSTAGADCGAVGGVFFTNPCAASLIANGQSTNGGSVQPGGSVYGGAITNANVNHTYTLMVPITVSEVLSDSISYIAEVAVTNATDESLTSPLLVDPSISFSSNFAGLGVSSDSGIDYENPPSPVPVPPTAWLFGPGLLAVFWSSRRRHVERH